MSSTASSPTRRTAFLFVLAAAFVLTNLVASDAFAQKRRHKSHAHTERHHAERRQVLVDVAFDRLDLRMRHGELHVDYEIARGDWRELKSSQIRPKLNLYVPVRRGEKFKYTYAIELTSRRGTAVFPANVSPARGKHVEVRLSGRRGHTRIARTSFGASCGERVRVAVHRPRHGQTTHVNQSEIARACSAQTSWSGDFKACIAKASAIRRDAVGAINACGAMTSWSGDFKACLDLSASLGRRKGQVIRACGNATSWSGDFKECLRDAAPYRADAAPVIRACGATTSWSGDFKDCLRDAVPYQADAARVIRACGAATSWSGDFKACMRGASHHGSHASHAVKVCSDSTSWSGDFKDCLQSTAL